MERDVATNDPSDHLKVLLNRFRQIVLSDEASYEVIVAKLVAATEATERLPEFSIVPTRELMEDGWKIGYRIGYGMSSSDGVVSARFTRFDYLVIGTADFTAGTLKADPELVEILVSNGREKAAVIDIAEVWQAGMRMLQSVDDQRTAASTWED